MKKGSGRGTLRSRFSSSGPRWYLQNRKLPWGEWWLRERKEKGTFGFSLRVQRKARFSSRTQSRQAVPCIDRPPGQEWAQCRLLVGESARRPESFRFRYTIVLE